MKVLRYTDLLMLIVLLACSPGFLSADESSIELEQSSLWRDALEGASLLKSDLEKQRKLHGQCPTTRIISGYSTVDKEIEEYYDYAIEKLVVRIESELNKAEVGGFWAELSVLVENSGRVESVRIYDFSSDFKKDEVEEIIGDLNMKLDPVPSDIECEKFDLNFNIVYSIPY